MLPPDVIESVADSYERVRGVEFARDFYRRFLAADDEVRLRFAKTDFDAQRELFLHGVFALIDFSRGRPLGKLALHRLAHKHGPGQLAIPSRLYDVWLTALLETLARSDPRWTPALREGWRAVLEPGIAVLRRG